MTVALASPFRAAPTISRDRWLFVLRETGSLASDPLWSGVDDLYDTREEAAGALYDYIVGRGHDPNRWLAIGMREHTLGTNRNSVLWRNNTQSWTNARSVRDPLIRPRAAKITDPLRGTEYVRYADVFDSVQDGIYRLEDETYVYVQTGADTIGEVFALWTEDPAEYAAFVVGFVNAHADLTGEEPPVPAPLNAPQVVRMILPRNASNTPGERMDWQYITVHNTGNQSPSATAMMHGKWLQSLAAQGATEPSWGYTVDDKLIVQHLEDDQAGWHASDGRGPGNLQSIGIELVEIGDQDKVLRNAAWLIAQKLHQRGVGLDRVRQHHDWARDKKNCPRLLRAGNGAGWQRLQLLVQAELDRLRQPQPDPEPDPDEIPAPPKSEPDPWGTTWWIASHFVDYIRRHDWMEFGYAVSEAFAERGADGRWRIVQYFERARLELNEGGEITRGLVGRESLFCHYPERRP